MKERKRKIRALMRKMMNQLEQQQHQNQHLRQHLQLQKKVVKKANTPKIIVTMSNQKINNIAIRNH
jgi:UDP-N-acetylmuramate-alanine ligase